MAAYIRKQMANDSRLIRNIEHGPRPVSSLSLIIMGNGAIRPPQLQRITGQAMLCQLPLQCMTGELETLSQHPQPVADCRYGTVGFNVPLDAL